jgi:hypothetical protein
MTNPSRSKKLQSVSLHVFCTRSELAGWLVMFCEERKQHGIVFVKESPVALDLTEQRLLADSLYRVFLFPQATSAPENLSMNDVRARPWGWIDVRPGREVEKTITLTSIEAEDFEGVAVQPVREVRWLKRRLKSVLISGVRGRNTETGGESVYPNMSYSPGALNEFRRGTTWKHDASDRAVFEPV